MTKTWKLVLLSALVVGSAQAKVQKPVKEKQSPAAAAAKQDDMGSAIVTETIQGVLSNVVQSGCHFQFTGSMTTKEQHLDSFDVNCALHFKNNVRINLMDKSAGTASASSDAHFDAELILETKDLWAVLDTNKEKGGGKLRLRFFQNATIMSGKKPWKEASLVARAATNVNANILTVNVSSVDISATVDPKNAKRYNINGNCASYQEFLDINEGRVVQRPAKCFVTGTFETGVGANLQYGYVDSDQGLVRP